MRLPALVLAGITSALAAYAWWRYEMRWIPDTDLYMQGGLGAYPSPLGRLLGSAEWLFVSASVAAAGTVVYSAVTGGEMLRRERLIPQADLREMPLCGKERRPPGRTVSVCLRQALSSSAMRGLALVLAPFVLYLSFVSADVIALGMYALFLSSRRWLWLLLASITHLAMIPYALMHVCFTDALSRLQKFVIGYFAGGTVVIVLWATPYGGIIGALDPRAGVEGLGLALLVGLPVVILYRAGAIHYAMFTVGALECAAQHHAQARYFLPALLLLAVTGRPRFGEVRTPSGGSYRWGLTPSPRSGMVGLAPRSMGRQRVGQVPAAYATSRKEP